MVLLAVGLDTTVENNEIKFIMLLTVSVTVISCILINDCYFFKMISKIITPNDPV